MYNNAKGIDIMREIPGSLNEMLITKINIIDEVSQIASIAGRKA